MYVQTKKLGFIILVTSLLFLSFFIALAKGSTAIPIDQLFSNDNRQLLLQLRLPRALSAGCCGALLALAGAFMQLLLQNPLADPYVLGVSGGAALGTLGMMLIGATGLSLLGGAWAGSLFAIICVLALARKHRWQPHTLMLSGVALAGGFAACISLVLLFSPAAHLPSMLFWLSGDLNHAHFPGLALVVLGIGSILAWVLAPGLTILQRGDREAQALGLPLTTFRLVLFFSSALFTATAVTLAGCIGFIGLLVPHLSRLLVGHNPRTYLPVAMVLGSSLLLLADTAARTWFAPQQLPVGILLALLGMPVFLWLLQK